MNFYFDPLNRACKSVIGAIAYGQECDFTVYALKEDSEKGDFNGVFFTPNTACCVAPETDLYLQIGKDGADKTS
ncbi:MAG: hypothetical protein IJB97_00640, partial [Clostridia bacterium]|nr:hypothetical protein [Clostridia bacterium]